MKEFINNHPKLYWKIVIALAVVVFVVVTCIGFAKLENANASEMSYEYEYLYSSVAYGLMEEWVATNVQEGQYYVVFAVDQNSSTNITDGVYQIGCIISDSETVSFANNGKGRYNLSANYWLGVNGSNISPQTGGYIQVGTNMMASAIYTLEGDISLVGKFPNATNVLVYEKPIQVMYSLDAPYTNYQNATMKYGYEAENIRDFYNDWMANNEWKYYGHLNNMLPGEDIAYNTEVAVVVQLPTIDYLISAFFAEGVELAVDTEFSMSDMYRFYKCLPDVVRGWNNDKKAPYVEYEFLYPMEIIPDANGNYAYGFTFLELEYMLKAYNATLVDAFGDYSAHFRAVYMTFAHIKCVTSMVETERADCIVYGKVTTNQFGRGIYGTCIEVIPEVDIETMTPEEMDKIIFDATEDAHDKYLSDLEERIDQLEKEMNNTTGALGGFDTEFEGNGLWNAIKGVGSGLLGMTGFLSSIAGVFGGVFSFMPYDVQQIVGYFLIVSLFIALWKLIKG